MSQALIRQRRSVIISSRDVRDVANVIAWGARNAMIASARIVEMTARVCAVSVRPTHHLGKFIRVMRDRFGRSVIIERFEDFFARQSTRSLIEAVVSAGNPYNFGSMRRSPGFGFGTSRGGFNLRRGRPIMGGHPGRIGGSTIVVKNAVKPYSDEFATWLGSTREKGFAQAKKSFLDRIYAIARRAESARDISEIEDIASSIAGVDPSEFLSDPGAWEVLLTRGDVRCAGRHLSRGMAAWARGIVDDAMKNGFDMNKLDTIVPKVNAPWRR